MDSFPPAGMLAQDVGTITISGETLLESKPWFSLRATLHISTHICARCGTRSSCTLPQCSLPMDADLLMASSVSCLRSISERKWRGQRAHHRLVMHRPMQPLQTTIWELNSRLHRQCHLQKIRFAFLRQSLQTFQWAAGKEHIDITMPSNPARFIRSTARHTRQSGILHARSAFPSSTQGKPGRLSPHADVHKYGTKCPFLQIV